MISMKENTQNYLNEERKLLNRTDKLQLFNEKQKTAHQKSNSNNIIKDLQSYLNPSIISLKKIKDMLQFTIQRKQ